MFSTAILVVVLTLLLLYLNSRKPKGYPPGPRWWPIVGSALEVAKIRQETGYLHKTCSALCERYGPIVGLKIGNDRIVVINDYDSMKAMLTNEDCDGRPNGPLYSIRTGGARRGLIVVDGHLWVEQRRFVLRHLREFGFGRTSMTTIIQDEAHELIQHFKKLLSNGSTRQLKRKDTSFLNHSNNGQIYKLQSQKENKLKLMLSNEYTMHEKPENCSQKLLKAADMYIKAEEYVEIRRVSQSSGMIISMHDAFGVTVLNTLWRMMAGKRFNTDDKQLMYLQRILTKILKEVDMIGAPFSHFPLLRFIAPEMSGYNSYIRTHQQLWKFLNDELQNHKNTFNPNSPRDLMDVYLAVLQNKDCGDTFSDSQLLGICTDLFIAGSETTSKALAFGFLYLILCPHIQKKAQREIDSVVGRERLPTLMDKPKMPYINAIVLESIRMFMGRTLNVPHNTLRDTYIKGYRIPKDTMLIVNYNKVLMDESWIDPEEFRPERFIDKEGNVVVPDKYFPFGTGRHRCMGETLARSNIFIITASLLQTFNFSVVPDEKKPSTQDFIDGVTAGTQPYRALISLRT